MARSFEDWRSNPVGEVLCSLYMRVAKLTGERSEREPLAPREPLSITPLNKWCRECKTGTVHVEYVWIDEDITTYECKECGALWTTE